MCFRIKQIITAVSLLIFSLSLNAQGKKPVKALVKYPYLIYFPEEYKSHPDSLFPVMIYLHGGSHRGNNLELLKIWGPPKLISEGKHFDFIVVSPQCPDNKLWISDNWFEPLFEDLRHQYRIDTSKIFVTGISMGFSMMIFTTGLKPYSTKFCTLLCCTENYFVIYILQASG